MILSFDFISFGCVFSFSFPSFFHIISPILFRFYRIRDAGSGMRNIFSVVSLHSFCQRTKKIYLIITHCMIAGLSDQNALTKVMVTKTYDIGGKKITFESGRLALLADGAVVIRDEEGNYLLTTVGVKEEVNMSASFFPLSVEFQEKYYATGKIGGNRFMKREGRPSEAAILNSRMIDRPIRPMFPKGTINDIQIISTIMSSSGNSDYGFYGITGASLALQLAGITEFEGPVAGIRIALLADGTTFKFDPTITDLSMALLDLTVAGTEDAITMVESQGKEVDESVMIRAFEFAHALVRDLISAQRDFVALYHTTHPITEKKLFAVALKTELKDIVD